MWKCVHFLNILRILYYVGHTFTSFPGIQWQCLEIKLRLPGKKFLWLIVARLWLLSIEREGDFSQTFSQNSNSTDINDTDISHLSWFSSLHLSYLSVRCREERKFSTLLRSPLIHLFFINHSLIHSFPTPQGYLSTYIHRILDFFYPSLSRHLVHERDIRCSVES